MSDAIKAKYNENRKKARAAQKAAKEAAGIVVRGKGRPKKVNILAPESDSDSESESESDIVRAWQAKTRVSDIELAVPPIAITIFGPSLVIPGDPVALPCMATRQWSAYSPSTQANYPSMFKTAMKAMNLTAPSTTDPVALCEWLLASPFDIWAFVEVASTGSIDTRNNKVKSLGAIVNAYLKPLALTKAEGPTFERLRLWSQVAHVMTKRSVSESVTKHESQTQSVAAADETVPWAVWWKSVKAEMDKPVPATFPLWRDRIILAAYTFIPPIRLNWANIEIVTKEPVKSQERKNYLMVKDGKIMTWWGDFKNRASFKDELPLRIPIESEILTKAMLPYLAANKTKWVFPNKHGNAWKHNAFGEHLGDLAQAVIGKRFTVQRMRAAYITSFHAKQPDLKIEAVRKVMRQMHQANLGSHLSYDKGEMEKFWNDQISKID